MDTANKTHHKRWERNDQKLEHKQTITGFYILSEVMWYAVGYASVCRYGMGILQITFDCMVIFQNCLREKYGYFEWRSWISRQLPYFFDDFKLNSHRRRGGLSQTPDFGTLHCFSPILSYHSSIKRQCIPLSVNMSINKGKKLQRNIFGISEYVVIEEEIHGHVQWLVLGITSQLPAGRSRSTLVARWHRVLNPRASKYAAVHPVIVLLGNSQIR